MTDRDKSKHKQEIAQNKGKVLKALLEHGELTRTEIAQKTGLIRGYVNGEYPAVSPLVKELGKENLIEVCTTYGWNERRVKRESEKIKVDTNVKTKCKSPKRGNKPAVWIIKQDISTIHTIFNTYLALQDILWRQEWVRDLIVKNQLDTRLITPEGIEELKEMLTLSPHFFRLCVNYNDLQGLTKEWEFYLDPISSELSPKELAKRIKELPQFPIAYPHISSYRNLFSFCYFADGIDGKEIDQGYEIVGRYTLERLHNMQESRRHEILSALEKVLIPTMKMFFDNINYKSFDIPDSKIPGGAKTLRSHVED